MSVGERNPSALSELVTQVATRALLARVYGDGLDPALVSGMANTLVIDLHGELDTRITSGWPAFDKELTAANVTHQGHVYPAANHGFHNDTTPRYDEAAAKLAWQRTLDWFNKYLR